MADQAEVERTPLINSRALNGVPDMSNVFSRSDSLPAWRRLRKIAYNNVEGKIDSPLEFIILGLIAGNVVLLAASTLVVDDACFGSKCARMGDKYESFFETAEVFSVCVFTFEYILRIWACLEDPKYDRKGPVQGRIAYATTFFAIVDLASIAPYWIGVITGTEGPDFTTAFRVFRLIRLLKADKYVQAFSLLGIVLAENSALLIASSFYAVLIWVVSATALHLVEMDNPALGAHFQSIPQALFPVLLMLTGEYPMADFSAKGQVIAGCIAVIAVAIFAIPSALLASSFVRAMQETMGREFTVDVG